MCPSAVTSIFSPPKVEKPKAAPTPNSAAVTQAGVTERQRQAGAVNTSTAQIVRDDRLGDGDVTKPKLLGA